MGPLGYFPQGLWFSQNTFVRISRSCHFSGLLAYLAAYCRQMSALRSGSKQITLTVEELKTARYKLWGTTGERPSAGPRPPKRRRKADDRAGGPTTHWSSAGSRLRKATRLVLSQWHWNGISGQGKKNLGN